MHLVQEVLDVRVCVACGLSESNRLCLDSRRGSGARWGILVVIFPMTSIKERGLTLRRSPLMLQLTVVSRVGWIIVVLLGIELSVAPGLPRIARVKVVGIALTFAFAAARFPVAPWFSRVPRVPKLFVSVARSCARGARFFSKR
jgi:hypothetical protein